jgi:hypothetical protein
VDSKSAFAGLESVHRFHRSGGDVFKLKVTEQIKAGWIGMPSHGLVLVLVRENMQRGMFERVVPAGFENQGEI